MKSKIIFIVGLPATGKTTLSEKLHSEMDGGCFLINTDDYLGDEDFMWALTLENKETLLMVEGTLGIKLLLRGLHTGLLHADTVYFCTSKSATRALRFEERGKNFTECVNLDRQLMKQWFEYVGDERSCKNIIEVVT